MKRSSYFVSKTEVAKFRRLYNEHGSLRAVGRICGRSQNTVEIHVSPFLDIRRQNRVTQVSNDECLKGVYVGLWLGDGTQYRDGSYRIKICSNKDDELLNRFIQDIIFRLFGKKTALITTKGNKSAYIKFSSQFIYEYIKDYAEWNGTKTNSVRIKGIIDDKSLNFIEGCLLGLMLSDGYLKETLMFNVTSKELAKDMMKILTKFNFKPSIYTHFRAKYGWNDLYMVKLNRNESTKAMALLDHVIRKLGYTHTFSELKYKKMAPR